METININMQKSQIHKYYFDNPEVWEEINSDRFNREPVFLEKIFKKFGNVKNILDVGSGTGSHLNKLSEIGFTGLGVDLNKNMVKYAKIKYPHLRFEVKDMRRLNYSNKFDAIICLCTTFCYNTTNKDVVTTLKSFRKALKKDGILIIETFNPISFLEKKKFERTIEELENYKKFGLKSVTEHWIDERKQQMTEKRSVYRLKDNKILESNLTTFRLFFPQEMRYFLETNGFKFLDFYGGYDTKDKSLDKFRLITIAKK